MRPRTQVTIGTLVVLLGFGRAPARAQDASASADDSVSGLPRLEVPAVPPDAAADSERRPFFRNEQAPLAAKWRRAEPLTAAVQAISMGSLMALPSSISNWHDR